MDQWTEFKQYELQQRQQRQAEVQRLSESQENKKKDAEQHFLLREQSRIASECQQAEERRSIEQQIEVEREQSIQASNESLVRFAEMLRNADRRNAEAQQDAMKKFQSGQQKEVWIGIDGRGFRSPLERDFWNEWLTDSARVATTPLIPQYQIGRYRVDFAHVASKIVIELDGRAYHTDRYAFVRDRIRHRSLEKQGWHVVRFASAEIQGNLPSCISETHEIIQGRLGGARTGAD